MADDDLSRGRAPTMERRIDLLERDSRDHARSLTELVASVRDAHDTLTAIDKLDAVRQEHDKHLDERLQRMERAIEEGFKSARADVDARFSRLNRPIWIAVSTLISTLVAAVATFIIKGGLM